MIKAYFRCNEGHYFNGENCPFDGWSSTESIELAKLSEKIISNGNKLSLEELKKLGSSKATLSRTIMMDFGENNFIFDAVLPEGYFIDGKLLMLPSLSKEFL